MSGLRVGCETESVERRAWSGRGLNYRAPLSTFYALRISKP
jgi:hypothetical protein